MGRPWTLRRGRPYFLIFNFLQMSTISKKLLGFIYNGANTTLASASFKNDVNIIYGFNPGGTGYTSFKPTSNFNSLTQLVQDGVYIVDAKNTGFDIPGATLTVTSTSAPSSPLKLVYLTPASQVVGGKNQIELQYLVNSSDSVDNGLAGVVWNLTTGFQQSVFNAGSVNQDGITSFEAFSNGASPTDKYRVDFISSNGHIISEVFNL
jgi:archaellum component FlaF (FlaF/FlaG flagellin family)